MDKQKINSMGVPLTTAQWREIDKAGVFQSDKGVVLVEETMKRIKSHLMEIVPKEKKYEGMGNTGRAIHNLKWSGYNQAIKEIKENINNL